MPAAQQAGTKRVVGEQKILDRMRLAGCRALAAATGKRVGAFFVGLLEAAPRGGPEYSGLVG
jgi:hypothetical protein